MPASERSVALTVDLEFFDSAFLFREERGPPPDEVADVGIDGVEFVANLLEQHEVEGTFFVLGEVAEAHPELIEDLNDRGHEIASHGYSKSHPDLRSLESEAVETELESSRKILEDITGTSVRGFRAPAFAMNDAVMDVVEATGFEYDSSIVPSRRIPGFYGSPTAPSRPFRSEEWFSTAGVVEYPIATVPLFRLPVSGAWMRLLGRRYALWGLGKAIERTDTAVLYVHPWELVDLPRYDRIPRRVYWRTGAYTRRTIERIVDRFSDSLKSMSTIHEERLETERRSGQEMSPSASSSGGSP